MERLSDSAARLLHSEAVLGYRRMGIVAVLDPSSDGSATAALLRDRIAERLALVPRLRRRIVRMDGAAASVDDDAFARRPLAAAVERALDELEAACA